MSDDRLTLEEATVLLILLRKLDRSRHDESVFYRKSSYSAGVDVAVEVVGAILDERNSGR